MAARRAGVLILAVYIFCAFFTIKKASFITEDGIISYTFEVLIQFTNQESYYSSTLWLFKRNCVLAKKNYTKKCYISVIISSWRY